MILKDAASASIYGARTANGVIVITTINRSKDGKTHVTYSGNVNFTPKPNYKSLNLITTNELIDLQVEGFPLIKTKYQQLNHAKALNPVTELLYKHKSGLISDTDLQRGLDYYRSLDNSKQLEDFYLQTGIMHQHNLALTGGNNKNNYVATLNYMGNRGTSKYNADERFGFTFRNAIKYFDWMKADFSVAGSFSKENRDLGVESFNSFYRGRSSYIMLKCLLSIVIILS